jgi:hypothetical protein
MAAGKFFTYTTAIKYILQGNIDLDETSSQVVVAYPLHSGYSPSTASHSALAQITNFQSTASSTIVNSIQLSSLNITGSGAVAVKFDADDIAGFSSDGDTFQCKYVALVAQSASAGGVDNLLIGFFDTDTAASTGVEATQVNVTWPAGGVFKVNGNQ